jgi:hypothetical protein
MKLRDCNQIADSGLPRIDAKDLEPLWISDYYDGPLAGVALHSARFCSYLLAEEEPEPWREGWYRRYWLIQLTPDQEDEERQWHDLFRAHVGTHWDHPVGTEPGRVKPREHHHLFYEPYSKRKPMVLDDNDVIGWFQF